MSPEDKTPAYGTELVQRVVWLLDGDTMYLKPVWELDLGDDGTCEIEGKKYRWFSASELRSPSDGH